MSKPEPRARKPEKKQDQTLKTPAPEQEAPTARPEHPLLNLQGSAGNRAVGRLVGKKDPPAGESVLIQRHLGLAAEIIAGGVKTDLDTIAMNATVGAAMLGGIKDISAKEPCTPDTEEPETQSVPPEPGGRTRSRPT